MEKVSTKTWEGVYRNNAHKQKPEKDSYYLKVASHELKTPLTILKAYVQLLEKHLKANGDHIGLKFSQKAIESLNKIEYVSLQLLAYSNLQFNNLEFSQTETAFHRLVDNVVESLQQAYASHEIIILNNPPLLVVTDKQKIEQVISNYICNAIKYSPLGGKIYVNVLKDEKYLTFSVKDSGIGIALGKTERIFEKYYRDEGALDFPGLGLGLHISSEIITLLNGAVWAESKIGKGSTFYFKIPLITVY
jgi:two-component system, OmpR family, phosphate regulon sensor histidine kinase PhoR